MLRFDGRLLSADPFQPVKKGRNLNSYRPTVFVCRLSSVPGTSEMRLRRRFFRDSDGPPRNDDCFHRAGLISPLAMSRPGQSRPASCCDYEWGQEKPRRREVPVTSRVRPMETPMPEAARPPIRGTTAPGEAGGEALAPRDPLRPAPGPGSSRPPPERAGPLPTARARHRSRVAHRSSRTQPPSSPAMVCLGGPFLFRCMPTPPRRHCSALLQPRHTARRDGA